MQAVRQQEIYETYKDQVEFFLVYIIEAHPSDGWVTPQNLYEEIDHRQPTTDDQRAEVAAACQSALAVKMPILLDPIDNKVDEAYIAEPTRYYLIDREGTLVFNGAQGPRGLDPDAWEAAIEAEAAKD